jgi:hypothetical protein
MPQKHRNQPPPESRAGFPARFAPNNRGNLPKQLVSEHRRIVSSMCIAARYQERNIAKYFRSNDAMRENPLPSRKKSNIARVQFAYRASSNFKNISRQNAR